MNTRGGIVSLTIIAAVILVLLICATKYLHEVEVREKQWQQTTSPETKAKVAGIEADLNGLKYGTVIEFPDSKTAFFIVREGEGENAALEYVTTVGESTHNIPHRLFREIARRLPKIYRPSDSGYADALQRFAKQQ
jgi:hypothetical protein